MDFLGQGKADKGMNDACPYNPNEHAFSKNNSSSDERRLSLHLNNLFSPPLSLSKTPATLVETANSIFDSLAVHRRLSFEFEKKNLTGDITSSDDGCIVESNTTEAEEEEQALFELVCLTILGSIVSEENPNLGARVSSELDGFKTPDNVPRMSGIAKECPGAPRRAINQVRRPIIDKRLCRKLEL